MPIKDGFEATEEIRKLEKKSNLRRTPIIAFTSHSDEKELNLALRSGMDTTLIKPCKKNILLKTIETFLLKNNNKI